MGQCESLIFIWILRVNYFDMCERKKTFPTIDFTFPLTIYIHPCDLHNITNLQNKNKNSEQKLFQKTLLFQLKCPILGITELTEKGNLISKNLQIFPRTCNWEMWRAGKVCVGWTFIPLLPRFFQVEKLRHLGEHLKNLLCNILTFSLLEWVIWFWRQCFSLWKYTAWKSLKNSPSFLVDFYFHFWNEWNTF